MKNGLTGFTGVKNVNREKAGTRILDALFPPRCAICDKVVPAGSGHICPDCRKGLKLISEPRCLKCGKGTMSAENEYCIRIVKTSPDSEEPVEVCRSKVVFA